MRKFSDLSMFLFYFLSTVFCLIIFGEDARSVESELLPENASAQSLLERSGCRGGLIVHVGARNPGFSCRLCEKPCYRVHILVEQQETLPAFHQEIEKRGLIGKVFAEGYAGGALPYISNLVNLIVMEKSLDVPKEEIFRVLAPGGVAYLRGTTHWEKIKKPWPEEIDQWTHYLHDATNNAVANDTVVGLPRHFQWRAEPKWARSHDHLSTVSSVVSANGRIFYIIDEGPTAAVAVPAQWKLVARDAFNGVLLWKRDIEPWEDHLRGFRSGPTELQRRLVAVEEKVFVTLGYGKEVSVLNAASGETIREYPQTKHTLEILYRDGHLFLVVGDRLPPGLVGRNLQEEREGLWHWWPICEVQPPRKKIMVVKVDGGETVWEQSGALVEKLLPTTLTASAEKVFFQNPTHLVALDLLTGQLLWKTDRAVNQARPTWSAPSVVFYDGIVFSADRDVSAPVQRATPSEKKEQWVLSSLGGHAPVGEMIAFDAETGKQLWKTDCRECYNAPVDVLITNEEVWSGNLTSKRDPGMTDTHDFRTGEVNRELPDDRQFLNVVMGHHRCYRNKGTSNYILLGRDGIELIDVKTGVAHGHNWVRGACQYGIMPCNGLIYVPPHSCACHIESKLHSFNVLAPARPDDNANEPIPEVLHGPAFHSVDHRKEKSLPGDWPTYRHDSARSGSGNAAVGDHLQLAWESKLPANELTGLVVARGKVFAAGRKSHAVYALDQETGKELWRFVTGGPIDSPPTYDRGCVYFGSGDGAIYCLRASDGEMVWRYRPFSRDRRMFAYDHLMSTSPVSGSVLLHEGVVFAVSGQSSHLDEGLHLIRLDTITGQELSRTPISNALGDVLSCDGEHVYMRHLCFDLEGKKVTAQVPHLFSSAGFLDGSWWHRTYWQFGTHMRSGWGAWPNVGNQVPAGRLLVMDSENIYGYGRLNQYHRNGSHVGLGAMKYLTYASSRTPEKKGGGIQTHWNRRLPVLVRAMALADGKLLLAGPPEVLTIEKSPSSYPYSIPSMKNVRRQYDAMQGKLGGVLLQVDTESGKVIAEEKLDEVPCWDSLAVVPGGVFLTTLSGKVICLK